MDLVAFAERHLEFSLKTFGPGRRLRGVCKHIEKELKEVMLSNGEDPYEWIDIIILALDGAMRCGHSPKSLGEVAIQKQLEIFSRKYPDWRTINEDSPIEHIRA